MQTKKNETDEGDVCTCVLNLIAENILHILPRKPYYFIQSCCYAICDASKCQKLELCVRFGKKELDMERLQVNEVNFKVKYEGQLNCSKQPS